MLKVGITRGAKWKRPGAVVAVSDTAAVVEGPSSDCCDKAKVDSSVEAAPVSMGIVRYSSRDCCDEGITRSSGEGVEDGVVEGGLVEGEVEVSTLWGSTSSYPDLPSDSITSGAPSIEPRRRVTVVTPAPFRAL